MAANPNEPGQTRPGAAHAPGADLSKTLPLATVLRIFLPFAAGYYLSYVFRTVNAVVAPDLVTDAGLAASDLGLLTSMYFIAFAVLQLPLGVLLDRFGPRRVESLLLLFAAAGSLLFAVSAGLAGLSLGRALIGAGVSCCMMAAFKSFAMWFNPRRLPLINGCLLTFGALGAISATAPVEWLLGFADWRALFTGLAVMAAVISVTVFGVVPDHRDPPRDTGMSDQLRGLAQVFSDPFFWRIAPLAAVSSGTSLAVHGLWAGPWLRDVAMLDRAGVANHLFIIASAMGVGFFAMGLLAERLARVGVKPMWIAATGMAGFMVAVGTLAAGGPDSGLWVLLVSLGFLATAASLSYSILSQHFSRHLAGRANTAQNLLVFIAAFLLQWGIGLVLGNWEDPATHRYAPEGYHVAFGSVAGLQLLALLWFLRPQRIARRWRRTRGNGNDT
jgi:MFS family permease